MPAALDGPSPGDIAALRAHYADVNRSHASASPSYWVRIRSAVVWRNMIFVEAGGDTIPSTRPSGSSTGRSGAARSPKS